MSTQGGGGHALLGLGESVFARTSCEGEGGSEGGEGAGEGVGRAGGGGGWVYDGAVVGVVLKVLERHGERRVVTLLLAATLLLELLHPKGTASADNWARALLGACAGGGEEGGGAGDVGAHAGGGGGGWGGGERRLLGKEDGEVLSAAALEASSFLMVPS